MRYRTGFGGASRAGGNFYYIIGATCGSCALSCSRCCCRRVVGCGGGLFRQYEYEEEMYLSLDGTRDDLREQLGAGAERAARRVVRYRGRARASIATAVRAVLHDAVTRVDAREHVAPQQPAVRPRAHRGRRRAARWPRRRRSRGRRTRSNAGRSVVYRQAVGAASSSATGRDGRGWNGDELVAFRLHLPSRSSYHNAGAEQPAARQHPGVGAAAGRRLRGDAARARSADGAAVDSLPHADRCLPRCSRRWR